MTLFYIYFHNWLRNKSNVKANKRKKGKRLKKEDANLKSETVLA